MPFCWGSRGYGYVMTNFGYFQYFPMFPMKSFFVSEDGDGECGVPIPMSLKSVLVGYIRNWCIPVGIIVLGLQANLIGLLLSRAEWAGFAAMILLPGCVIAASFIKRGFWIVLHGFAMAASIGGAVLCFAQKLPNTSLLLTLTLSANGLLLLYALTRAWDFAGRNRSVELAGYLGIDPLNAEEILAAASRR